MVDQLGGAGGSAEADCVQACLLYLGGLCGVEDELFAELVDRGGACQSGRAGHAEVVRNAFDRAREVGCAIGFQHGLS